MAIEKVLVANNTSVIQDEKMKSQMRRTSLFSNSILSVVQGVQEIELEAHAVKGMGKTHVKWSPVTTAWYRMLPEVVLLQEVEGDKVEELMKKCPVNEFDIEDIGKVTIESTRTLPPEVLFAESVKFLEDKCEGVITELL